MTKTILLILALPCVINAQPATKGYSIDTAGLRAGSDNNNSIDIDTAELYATVTTPYQWSLGGTTSLSLKLEGAVGILDSNNETGFYLRVGPQLVLSFGDSPLHIVASAGPAYLSDYTYNNLNLGGNFQFFTSVGLDWDINIDWTLGYRWQHISNARIHDVNPGLNMHTLGFSYKF